MIDCPTDAPPPVAVTAAAVGVVLLGPAAEVPLNTIKHGFDVNVFGLIDMCQVRMSRVCPDCR